jgi:hypothetical protein
MQIRKTQEKDIKDILEIYHKAREYMRANNNFNQWDDDYPGLESLKEDMTKGVSYVLENDDGEVLGTFAFIIGEDPYYGYIEEGSWTKDEPYGVIHRIASSGKVRNFTRICLDFCIKEIPYLRIDTHEDNLPMQGAIKAYGFEECGIIYVRGHSPRLAFDYYKK